MAAGLGLALLAGGCGSVASQPAAPSPAVPAPLSLSTSTDAAGATWATVPMGAASGADEFWELFVLPGGGQWSLRTPPDIATNGAIVLAAPDAAGPAGASGSSGTAGAGGTGQAGGGPLVAGVRPSLDLAFSPITSTSDLGRSWTVSPPQSGLADVPDALAAAPGAPGGSGGSGVRLIGLGQDGAVSVTGAADGTWGPLTTERALASAPAARDCDLTGLTAVAYTPAGSPLLAGTCGRGGRVGVFGETGGTWHLAAPALPASLGGQAVRVLRLSRSGHQDVALLEAGAAPSISLLAAWSSDGEHWRLSPVLRAGGSAAVSASFGDGGVGAVLAGDRAETISGPGSSWRRLPARPAGRTVTLTLPGAGPIEALAASAGTLTVWRLTGDPGAWVKAQSVKVPIQYGSSS
jgi:hypothetical protein